MRTIEEKIKKYITDYGLLSMRDRLLVALSGGADSVCLLLTMLELGYTVGTAHCNFRLRGDESERDEQFVRDLCGRLGVEIHVESFDTKKYAEEKRLSIEMAARELRYRYFNKVLRDKGYTKICIAHHGDDAIETFFINILRGSGIRGLCGIQPKNGRIIRPLLCCRRQEVLDYLSERGEHFVTDSTNNETEFLRNKIRLQVLPLLENISSSARDNILTTIGNLNEDYKIYRWCTGRMEEESSYVKDGMLYVSKEALQRSPSPISLFHEILRECGFNRTQLVQAISSMDKSGKVFYSKEYKMVIDRDYIIVSGYEEDVDPIELTIESSEGEFDLAFGNKVTYTVIDRDKWILDKSPDTAFFDLRKLGKKFIVRKPVTGDYFIPFGMKGRKLVSDLLTDLKKSKFEKERQLILEANGKIAWVVGVRVSEEFKVDDKTEKVIKFKI